MRLPPFHNSWCLAEFICVCDHICMWKIVYANPTNMMRRSRCYSRLFLRIKVKWSRRKKRQKASSQMKIWTTTKALHWVGWGMAHLRQPGNASILVNASILLRRRFKRGSVSHSVTTVAIEEEDPPMKPGTLCSNSTAYFRRISASDFFSFYGIIDKLNWTKLKIRFLSNAMFRRHSQVDRAMAEVVWNGVLHTFFEYSRKIAYLPDLLKRLCF